MGLRKEQEFKAGLRDGRAVYSKGERVDDVTNHPDLGICCEHVALDYRLPEDPEQRDLFVYEDENGELSSRYFKKPSCTEDLLNRREMIERSTRLGGSVVLLIKEIGTDALFALDLVSRVVDAKAGTNYGERVAAFHRKCRREDLALAVAQTDAKGDRSLLPSQQEHPDYYVHVVEERSDGIVVRGAKAHTTNSPFVDYLIVIPTRAIGEADSEYAVAFAVPVGAEGVKLIASPFGSPEPSRFHHPVSSRPSARRHPDRLRRCLCSQRERVSQRGVAGSRVSGQYLRRVPPVYRGVVQATPVRHVHRSRGSSGGVQRHRKTQPCA